MPDMARDPHQVENALVSPNASRSGLVAAAHESLPGTQEKVLVRPANMPGIWAIPDMDLRASSGGEHGSL
jgi:hypothetical protein